MVKYKLASGVSFLALALFTSSNVAYAVSDSEFELLQIQMKNVLDRLNTLEQKNKELKKENIFLKQQQQQIVQNTQAVKQISSEQDISYKVGGYIKVDAIHDIGMTRSGNGEDFGLFAAIPLEGSVEEQKGSHTRIHARQTRLNLTATKQTERGPLKAFIEGDFYGTNGSQNTTNASEFRLRHAFFELDGFKAGHTWSNYMDLAAYPESLDFIGPAGNTLLRQAQLRYTHTDEHKNQYSISLENPQSDFNSNPGNTGADSSLDKGVDVVAAAKLNYDFGHLMFKGALRQLEEFNDTTNKSDKDYGYALAVSGKYNVGEKDDIRFQLAYGEGIGRYIFDLAVTSQSAGFTDNPNNLEKIDAWAGYASYRHFWNTKLRSNIMFGMTEVSENPDYLNPATTNSTVMSAHANIIWNIVDGMDTGLEYVYGRRETVSGAQGQLNRIIASAKFKF